MKLGIMFGNPETTTGGQALKFYASTRMDIRSIGKIEEQTDGNRDKQISGIRVRVKVVKNKIAPPFKMAEFDILYKKGISFAGDVLDLAVQYDLVRKAGAFFSYGTTKIGQGRENARLFLEQNHKMMKEIEKALREHLKKVEHAAAQ